MRFKEFVDLPVTENTRNKVRKKKGERTYDQYINELMKYDLSGDRS
ncbi:MAG: hypothetical protein ACRD9Q_01500 [Nitrososphaeraceae archaeon]